MMRAETKIVSRRPLLFGVLFFMLGITLGFESSAKPGLCLALCAMYLAVGISMRRFRAAGALMLAALLFAGMAAAYGAANPDTHGICSGDMRYLTGTVVKSNARDEGTIYCLENAMVGENRLDGNILLKSQNGDYALGDIIFAKAMMRLPEKPSYPGGFDDERYCAANGVLFRAYAEEDEKTGRIGGFAGAIFDMRLGLAEHIDEIFADQAPLAKAFILGIRSDISDTDRDAFAKTGISHVLVVSGLHVGFMAGLLYYILRRMNTPMWLRLPLMGGFLIFYILLTGGDIPVIRASLLFVIALLARACGKRTDILTSLSLALFIVLMARPAALFDIGLQLSFGAVFSLACWGGAFSRWLGFMGSYASGLLGAAAAVQIGLLPLQIEVSNRVWLPSIFVNIITIAYCALMMPAMFVITMLECLIGTGWGAIRTVCRGAVALLGRLAQSGESMEVLAIYLPCIGALCIAFWFAAVFVCSQYTNIGRLRKLGCGLMTMAMMLYALCGLPGDKNRIYVEFPDIGGQCAVIHTEEGTEALVDTAAKDAAVVFLTKSGVCPEKTFITSAARDAIGGLKALLARNMAGEIYTSAKRAPFLAQKYGCRAAGISTGETVALSARCAVTAVYAGDYSFGYDEAMSALLLTVDGRAVCLFVGEAAMDYSFKLDGAYAEVPFLRDCGQIDYYDRMLMEKNGLPYGIIAYGYEGGVEKQGVPIISNRDRGTIYLFPEKDGIRLESMYAGG